MKKFMKTKAGVVLVGFSVLAVWMLAIVQSVQAHSDSLPSPGCSSSILPEDEFFTGARQAITSTNFNNIPSLSTKKGNDDVTDLDSGDSRYYYAKITVPALTAGELMVSDATTDALSDAVLCRGGTDIAESLTNYRDHDNAESAKAAAERAAMDADADAEKSGASLSTLRSDLRAAANALGNAADALRKVGTADADTAAGIAETDETTADGVADDSTADENVLDGALRAAADDLEAAARALGEAATADHMGFTFSALISSGDEEYVVVVAVPADADEPSLTVMFDGVMSTDEDAPDGGSLTRNNQRDEYALSMTTTTNGLLTLKTTGNTDTIGELFEATSIADAEAGGSGGNFEIIVPVKSDAHTVFVTGQNPTTRGDYTLEVDFKVAMDVTYPTSETPGEIEDSDGEDHFFFEVTDENRGFLTVETIDPSDSAQTTSNTTGTLYGPDGKITDDSDGGSGSHFRITAPVKMGNYVVEVDGNVGYYRLQLSSQVADTTAGLISSTMPGAPKSGSITAPMGSAAAPVDHYLIDVKNAGLLEVKTTGAIGDTVGVLYGPDGRQIATDDNSGEGDHFRILENVSPGLYLVTVEGRERDTAGEYMLFVNFIEAATAEDIGEPTPRPEPDPSGPVDSIGVLEEPPHNGVRSGIGLVRGWVCQAGSNSVQIRITGPSGPNSRTRTITAPYGSARADVASAGHCDRRGSNFGFAAQINYNNLPEGTYTVQASAGRLRIGLDDDQTNTFEVVHISDQPFLEGLSREVTVQDFPFTGDTTVLEWDQSSQNFQIME